MPAELFQEFAGQQAVNGIFAGTCKEQEHEDDKISEGQFALCKRSAMRDEEGNGHCERHRNDGQAGQETEDDGCGAHEFTEDGHAERQLAADAERIGECGRERLEALELLQAV